MMELIRGTPLQVDELLRQATKWFCLIAGSSTLAMLIAVGAAVYIARRPSPAPVVVTMDHGVPTNILLPFPGTVTPDYETVAHISQYITEAFGIDTDDHKEREVLQEVADSSSTQAGNKIRAWYHEDKDANNPWALHTKYSQDVQILSVLPLPNSPNAYEAHFLVRRYNNTDYQQVATTPYRLTLVTRSGEPRGSNLFGIYFDSLAFAKEGE